MGDKILSKEELVDKFLRFNSETFELSVKIQMGPVKEVGQNGCQIDDVIEFCKKFIDDLNSQFPCNENHNAIMKLEEALLWLLKRKLDRERRGVEGQSKN